MAWNIVAGSAHAVGQFMAGDIIWRVADEGMASQGQFYELKVGKINGISKPVLMNRDSRSPNPFSISSGEYFNNIKPDNQIDGLSLFASISDLAGKTINDVIQNGTSVGLWMDANGKLVATAPASSGSGSLTIPIPSGGNIVIIAQPQYGTVSLVSGAIQYTASNGYSGSDAFTYEIRGASGDLISTGTCSFSTSAATATAVPTFAKAVIDVTGDIRVNCVAGSAVSLYKNGDTNIVSTLSDSSNVGYVLFQNVSRVQNDTFKAKAQKAGLTISGFSIQTTAKRKPSAISGVTKTVQANGTVSISIADLVTDSENATFF
jgi:Bacterial Ig domain